MVSTYSGSENASIGELIFHFFRPAIILIEFDLTRGVQRYTENNLEVQILRTSCIVFCPTLQGSLLLRQAVLRLQKLWESLEYSVDNRSSSLEELWEKNHEMRGSHHSLGYRTFRSFILCTSSVTTSVAKIFHSRLIVKTKRLISSEIFFCIAAECFRTVDNIPCLKISHISSVFKFYFERAMRMKPRLQKKRQVLTDSKLVALPSWTHFKWLREWASESCGIENGLLYLAPCLL